MQGPPAGHDMPPADFTATLAAVVGAIVGGRDLSGADKLVGRGVGAIVDVLEGDNELVGPLLTVGLLVGGAELVGLPVVVGEFDGTTAGVKVGLDV